MKEPSPRASRLALTAGLVGILVVGGGGFLLGRRSTPERAIPAAPVVVAPAPAPVESAPRVLGRADLIALAGEAADATARGEPLPASVRDAVGKPFAIALPFGCEGPAEAGSAAPMRWRYDDAAGALRVTATPVTWSPDEWWAAASPSRPETIEGFWIARPWTRRETCPAAHEPAAPAGAEPVTLAGQTLAIGQAFGAEGARQGRRDGKPYASVLRMAPTEADLRHGLALRLTGRLAGGPDGTPATCRQPGGPDQRPVCLILVSLDALAIADPGSGKILSTWPTESPRDASDAR